MLYNKYMISLIFTQIHCICIGYVILWKKAPDYFREITLNQSKVKELSKENHLVLLCGHYEGIDQRVLDEIVDEEISIGDYVLTRRRATSNGTYR